MPEFTHNFQSLSQRPDCVKRKPVPVIIIIYQVNVKEVFPGTSHNWKRLNLCKADPVEGKNGEHLGERADLMRE